jgi:hypothetical protein
MSVDNSEAISTGRRTLVPQPGYRVSGMIRLLAITHDTSVTVAEVAFLLLLIAGVWIAVAWLLESQPDHPLSGRRFRMIVAGALIAVAGVLLIIATHWGHLFS